MIVANGFKLLDGRNYEGKDYKLHNKIRMKVYQEVGNFEMRAIKSWAMHLLLLCMILPKFAYGCGRLWLFLWLCQTVEQPILIY